MNGKLNWKNHTMREDMLQALERVIIAYYDDEKKHYEEWKNLEGHIFHDLEKIANFIKEKRNA